jgi:hypothetical protein
MILRIFCEDSRPVGDKMKLARRFSAGAEKEMNGAT